MELAKVPGLPDEPVKGAAHDWRLSAVLRARFGSELVQPCGALEIDARLEARVAAKDCVERAVAAGKPYV